MAPTDYKERTARLSSARAKQRKRSSKAKRPAARNSVANGVSRWRWFAVGLCVGAVATAALFLYEPSVVKQVASSKGVGQTQGSPKPKFEFYALLPEMETAIPETEPVPKRPSAEPKTKKQAAPATPATAQDRYMLQVGSFRRHGDADREKAKLALLGFMASIQTISVNGQETWHRVQVGPYTGRNKLDNVQTSLKNQGFEVMPLRLKGRE